MGKGEGQRAVSGNRAQSRLLASCRVRAPSQQREQLVELFSCRELSSTGLSTQFRKLLAGPWATPDVAYLIAFSYFEDAFLKQALLAEPDVRTRVQRVIDELDRMRVKIRPATSSLHPPSMN